MQVSAIVAMSRNRTIGMNNQLPWHLGDDLKIFKRITLDKHVIMGRKCFESIGNPLPKRTNIILSRNPYFLVSNAFVVDNLEDALGFAEDNGEQEAMIIGGEEIYTLSLPYLDTLYLTEIQADIEGDTFFPEIHTEEWKVESIKKYSKSEVNDYDFEFKILRRIQ
jgi:dihydrofolate reductase